MKKFAERIKSVRLRLGQNQGDLAVLLGVSVNSVGNWESGKQFPHGKKLGEVAEKLGVTTAFLLGDDDASQSIAVQSQTPPLYGVPAPPPHVKSNARFEPEKFLRLVPVVSYAAAGTANDYTDLANHIDETVLGETTDPNAFALIVEGDSMEPDYHDGDRVIFAPNAEARSGDLVVAKLDPDKGVVIKFLRRKADGKILSLESSNKAYSPIEVQLKQVVWLYPAVGLCRRIKR